MNNSGILSDSKSVRTTGGGLGNKLTSALSRVASNFKAGTYLKKNADEMASDEDFLELQQTMSEFNSLADLIIKYNSCIKICKIIEANDDPCFGPTKTWSPSFSDASVTSVRQLFDTCKDNLLSIQKSKDKEIESYLEEFAEEKV